MTSLTTEIEDMNKIYNEQINKIGRASHRDGINCFEKHEKE